MNLRKLTLLKRPNILDKIKQDKLLHYMLGTWCFVIVMVSLSFVTILPLSAVWIALFVVGIFGIGIEIFQKITKTGAFQISDAIAVWIGGIVPSALMFI